MEISDKKQRLKAYRKAAIVLASVLLAAAVLVYIPPLIVVEVFTNGHVDYLGEATAEAPLQGVYAAEDFGLKSDDFMLTAPDGVKIFVSEISARDPKGVVIFLTGIRQPSVTYFYPQAGWLSENGYSSLLLEVRAHGRSEGETVSLGYLEPLDVAAVVDYISNCPDYTGLPITICGVSMGGASAITSFGSIAEIDGCIAMSAYSSFETQVSDLMSRYYAPRLLCDAAEYGTAFWLSSIFGANTVREMSPINQAANANGRSLLLIAAIDDQTVSAYNTVDLAAAAGDSAEIWIRNTSDHFIVRDCDFFAFREDTEYCERILTFLKGVTN